MSAYANLVFGRILGEGSYSTVLHAQDPSDSSRQFAVKVVEKRHIIRHNKQKYAKLEKDALSLLCHPHIIKLHATFQDSESLYFVLELCPNGDLLQTLSGHGTLSMDCVKLCMCQATKAVNYMHSNGVVHRDLKPENMLISKEFTIKLCDFGTVKFVNEAAAEPEKDENKRSSFVGTAEYTSPELLQDRQTTFKSDVWALGCIIYQLIYGITPFKSNSEYLVFQKITAGVIEFPQPQQPFEDVNLLILKCLEKTPEKRIDTTEMMNSTFLSEIAANPGLTTTSIEFKPGFKDFKWKENRDPS